MTRLITCVLQDKTNGSIDDKATEPLDGSGGTGGSGVVVRALVDGDREDTQQAPISGEGKNQKGQEEKEKSASKAGKSKRKRPANRCLHEINICTDICVYLRMYVLRKCVCLCLDNSMFLISGSCLKKPQTWGKSLVLRPPAGTECSHRTTPAGC